MSLDFESNHQIFQIADKYNSDHADSDTIMGWVRSYPSENITISSVDKKNLLYFQTAYSDAAVMLAFDNTGDQYAMQVKHFNAPLPEVAFSRAMIPPRWKHPRQTVAPCARRQRHSPASIRRREKPVCQIVAPQRPGPN